MSDPTFSVIMTVFQRYNFTPHALHCVKTQTYHRWELIVLEDGKTPEAEREFDTHHLCKQIAERVPNRIHVVTGPHKPGLFGNHLRADGLRHAQGTHVVWMSHDTLLSPGYLAAHADNIRRTEGGCLSIVSLEWWSRGHYMGLLPKSLNLSEIDLTNYAMPLATARQIDAFGKPFQERYDADGLVFLAAKETGLTITRNDAIVGGHF